MIPQPVIDARQAVCRDSCTEQCAAFLEGTLAHADSKTRCPRTEWILAWGCYGPCQGPPPPGIFRPPPPKTLAPTPADLMSRAAYAAWRAAAALIQGERVLVTEDEYAGRSAACEACTYWDGLSRGGLGTCRAPGCGCTALKRWLATERCTHPGGSRWPVPVLTTSNH